MHPSRWWLPGELVAILGVGLASLALWVFQVHLGDVQRDVQRGMLFLLVVAAAAVTSGTRAGLLAAVLGFLAWNFFFLPPVLTFHLANPEDWLTLFTFLAIGTLLGQMTGRARVREADARAREEETAALYRMAATLNEHATPARALPLVAAQVREMVPLETLAVIGVGEDGQVVRHAIDGDGALVTSAEVEPVVRWVLKEGQALGLPHDLTAASGPWPPMGSWREAGVPKERSELYLPLATKQRVSGVLVAVPRGKGSLDVPACRLLVAAAAQISAFLERHLLQQETAALINRQEADKMRLVLLSSLSHNLKTPLASLNATLGGLTAHDVEWTPEMVRDSVDLMAEDVTRLTHHITNLLDQARLESGTWQPQREWFQLHELVDMGLRLLPSRDRDRVRLGALSGNPTVSVDPVQVGQVVRHLVENALMYSPPASTVWVDATMAGSDVQLTVDDEGAGVAPEERERIFEKLYRGRAAKKMSVRGTGLGLSICQEIVSAHAGRLEIASSPQGGARFIVSLPVEPRTGEPGESA